MKTLVLSVVRFASEEDAPSMVEYGILIAAISILVGMSGRLLGQLGADLILPDAIE